MFKVVERTDMTKAHREAMVRDQKKFEANYKVAEVCLQQGVEIPDEILRVKCPTLDVIRRDVSYGLAMIIDVLVHDGLMEYPKKVFEAFDKGHWACRKNRKQGGAFRVNNAGVVYRADNPHGTGVGEHSSRIIATFFARGFRSELEDNLIEKEWVSDSIYAVRKAATGAYVEDSEVKLVFDYHFSSLPTLSFLARRSDVKTERMGKVLQYIAYAGAASQRGSVYIDEKLMRVAKGDGWNPQHLPVGEARPVYYYDYLTPKELQDWVCDKL